VLDVKIGQGAFMETLDMGRELAAMMERIGDLAGRKTVCMLSDMNQPLGHAVGNALELAEPIEALHGGGPPDFREHCLQVSAQMLQIGGRTRGLDDGRRMAEKAIADGTAFGKFRVLVEAQGGDVSYVDHPEKLPRARLVETIHSPRSGWLAQVRARDVGEASVALGAGRANKSDKVDHAVGIVVAHKVGDRVEEGEALFSIHANDERKLAEARDRVLAAHVFSDAPVPALPLFYS
jgi:pyrimidine-nucleoside phosphorylase